LTVVTLPSGPRRMVTRLGLKSIVSITPGGAQRRTDEWVARRIAAPVSLLAVRPTKLSLPSALQVRS